MTPATPSTETMTTAPLLGDALFARFFHRRRARGVLTSIVRDR